MFLDQCKKEVGQFVDKEAQKSVYASVTIQSNAGLIMVSSKFMRFL